MKKTLIALAASGIIATSVGAVAASATTPAQQYTVGFVTCDPNSPQNGQGIQLNTRAQAEQDFGNAIKSNASTGVFKQIVLGQGPTLFASVTFACN